MITIKTVSICTGLYFVIGFAFAFVFAVVDIVRDRYADDYYIPVLAWPVFIISFAVWLPFALFVKMLDFLNDAWNRRNE